MKERVYIIGVGMTKISKNGGTYEALCTEAIAEAMTDAALSYEGDKGAIGCIWYGNCGQGMLTSQHSIRGQVILRRLGFEYGYTQEQLAKVCAKTHNHSTMNPKAQYRMAYTFEEVLADKLITYPLTKPMCAPTGEGCAAAVVCSEAYLKAHPAVQDPILVRASVMAGERQVMGAKIGMHINGGGVIGVEEAAMGVEILERAD